MSNLTNRLGKKPIIIAEVGQNHQGSLKIAKQYIKEFAFRGADIIKFQSRNNKELFSKDAYEKNYNSENSFGKTYGEHREKLELSFSELKILKKECNKYKLKFMITPFDEKSLELISKVGVDIIKIASFDLGNLPFIDLIAKKKKVVAISTGGGNLIEIKKSVELLQKRKIKVILLHCVSEYPCPYNNLGLENITLYKKKFPKCIIGSSDHFNGILSGPVAYLQGARVFEKHVTLNRGWKGTDHSFALEPEGFGRFVRDIHRTGMMLPTKKKNDIGKEPVFTKLGKSLIANKLIKKGKKIKINDLSGKIFQENIVLVRYSHKIIGKKVKKNILKGTPISFSDII
ncbi:N-acetylneuraminate synthase family protein [Pelagibacteraceae bacterium]|jgi:sialic acid synthase|nr:N-acetylneuraminate synthase family protein [Pelagibacteraceae bacterium]